MIYNILHSFYTFLRGKHDLVMFCIQKLGHLHEKDTSVNLPVLNICEQAMYCEKGT